MENAVDVQLANRLGGRGLTFIAVLAAALIAGCGGGGDSSSPATSTPAAVTCNSGATAGTAPAFNGKQTLAVCPNLFVEATIVEADRVRISNMVLRAVERDRAYYGSLLSTPPDVIVCSTAECGTYFAGPSLRNTTLAPNTFAAGATFVAPRTTIVLTGIAADTENVLTHEGSHVQLAAGAAVALLASVKGGATFYSAYGAFLTQ